MRQKVCQEWDDKVMVNSSCMNVRRKQAAVKTRKSIGTGKCLGSDDHGVGAKRR